VSPLQFDGIRRLALMLGLFCLVMFPAGFLPWAAAAPQAPQQQYSWWNPRRYFDASPEAPPSHQASPYRPGGPTAGVARPLAPAPQQQAALLETERGNIGIVLYPQAAPKTVENFTRLVQSQFYNAPSMVFHRVLPGFVIQTGDPTGTGYGGSDRRVPLEVKNRLSHNAKGMVAMARGSDPNSATSQFYITLSPQPQLDGKYAVFGQVVSGMAVLDRIRQGDKLYGVQLVDAAALKPDAKPSGSWFSRWTQRLRRPFDGSADNQ
jgi:peptidylprolyl isomerase/peptidyl-prolyl cis-trans isomerase B (cyclophilin B)